MHDMSNTRKEIAARLGFAAKEVFAADKRTTAGALRKALKAKGITSAADLEWHGISAKDPDSTPYWLYEDGSMEKIKASRPGAKAAFGRAEEVYRLLETTPSSYNNAKKLDAFATEAMRLADITPAGKDVSLHELAEMVGQDLEADRSRMSRPGAKAAFDNKQIAQGLSRLLKETGFDGMASDVLSGSSDSETLRKYVRVLKGKMSPLSGDAKSAELLSKLEKMLSARSGAKTTMAKPPRKYEHGDRVYIMDGNKRVGSGVIDYMFDYDDFVGTYIYKVRQEDGGRASYNETSLKKMSRPGAKAGFAKWEVTPTKKNGVPIEEHTAKIGIDLWKIDTMPHAGVGVGSLYRWDKLRGLRLVSTGQVDLLKKQAEAISTKKDAISDLMRGFSRPGAKTRMTREQTEEQKAGLKIMSAADPAVGAKIATLIKEGKPQDQAVAIALDMKRRGEL